MANETSTILSVCGRMVGADEIRHVQEVVDLCPGLSRRELALTLCEHWGWFGITGKALSSACEKLLDRLEREGLAELPTKQVQRRPAKASGESMVDLEQTSAGAAVSTDLGAVQPIRLEVVEGRKPTHLCNGLIQRYHPLGYKRPFGFSLRYYVTSARGRLGCLLLAGASRSLRCRDEWIGWSAAQRLHNLPLVINNSRFLVFPWIRVPHLASHVLGQLGRQVRKDWAARWGYEPLVMETFVDPARHRGTCYRAAGWEVVGESSGRGLRLRNHSYQTSRKLVLVRPLVRDFRARLLCDPKPRSFES